MKQLNYIFISIAYIMLLMSSCAKEEMISIGSVKIETKIQVLTPTTVHIEFSHINQNIEIYAIRYKKKSSSEDFYYSDYIDKDTEGCLIKGLEPNTSYIYEFCIDTDDSYVLSDDKSVWLSDPSYTFSTNEVSEGLNNLYANMEIESLTNSTVVFKYKLIDKIGIHYDFPVKEIYLNTDPNDKGNRIQVTYYTQAWNEYDWWYYGEATCKCFVSGLQPETTYYIFIDGVIRFGDSEYDTIHLNNTSINLTPQSFTTMSNESFFEDKTKASLSTSFLSQDRAVIKIQYDDSIISYGDNLSVTISENQDGSNPIITTNTTSFGKNSYIKKRGIIEFAVVGLKPSTKYYIFVKGDVVYELTNLQDYEKAKDIPLSFSDNSFTTKEAGDYGIDLNVALTINYTSKFRTDFQFDFDKNLTTYSYDAKITLNGLEYQCNDAYNYNKGLVKFYVYGLEPNTSYTIDQFLVTMLYTTDSGVQIPLSGSIDNPEPIDIIPTPNSFTTPDWK